MRGKIDSKWAKIYGLILRKSIELYGINKVEFVNKANTTEACLRQWYRGRCFPSDVNHAQICKVLEKYLSDLSNSSLNDSIIYFINTYIKNLRQRKMSSLQDNEIGKYIATQLKICYSNGKLHQQIKLQKQKILSNFNVHFNATGRTQAVIFDFDGTLTKGNTGKTTWESIWTKLGYKVKDCRDLHSLFDKADIDHEQWCKRTEKKFKERGLNKEMVLEIARKIELIDGCEETFSELQNRNIKIYVVSGSILIIIQEVLKHFYYKIDGVKANDFKFSQNGLLLEIIGTKYDFAGKAEYIKEVAENLRISTGDILFVGNSRNDKWAYESGAETLCINPRLADTSDRRAWRNIMEDCNNLLEIFEFIKPVSKIKV
jgi:HAD superfamily phosphoserine phosphatase-like hydrolase